MVMKDKLVKTHHKAMYYTVRKVALVAIAAASFVCAVFIPTYIVATAHRGNSAIHAQENSVEVVDQNQESESLETYEESQTGDQGQSQQ